MQEILDLAQRLGKAVAASPEAAKLRDAQKALETEADTAKLLEDYAAQSQTVAQLQRDRKPVEVEDKHKLQELHDKLVASEAFKKLTAAQVEYADVMRRVNEAIGSQLRDVADS